MTDKKLEELLRKAKGITDKKDAKEAEKAAEQNAGNGKKKVAGMTSPDAAVAEAAKTLSDGSVREVASGYVKSKRFVQRFWNYTTKESFMARAVKFLGKYTGFNYLWKKANPKNAKSKLGASLRHAARVYLLLWPVSLLSGMIGTVYQPMQKVSKVAGYTTTEFAWDGIRMAGWGWQYNNWGIRKDTVYLTGYVEKPGENVYTVSGTTVGDFESGKAIGVKQSLYFDLKSSLAHNIWSFIHKGSPHNTSLIIGPVVSSSSHPYVVTHYGNAWKAPIVSDLFDLRGHDDILDIERLPDNYKELAAKGQLTNDANKSFGKETQTSQAVDKKQQNTVPVARRLDTATLKPTPQNR